MADYYFDVETYTSGEKPNPTTDKIIAITLQHMDTRDGSAFGPPILLTEWKDDALLPDGEKQLLTQFHSMYFRDKSSFAFVLVGSNILRFDLIAVASGWKRHGLNVHLGELYHNRLHYDIFTTQVLCNGGHIKDCGLDKLTNKQSNGSQVASWYVAHNYKAIEEYAKQEAQSFLEFYRHLVKNMPSLLDSFPKGQPASR